VQHAFFSLYSCCQARALVAEMHMLGFVSEPYSANTES